MKAIFSACVLMLMFAACGKNAAPVTYYLPENYNGIIAVIYSQKNAGASFENGRLKIVVPASGIVMTSAAFSDGWRDDLFLMKNAHGFDTLKTYLPGKDSNGEKVAAGYHNVTADSNVIAVNFRQLVNTVPVNGGSHPMTIEYELITIGRAATLDDSIGAVFKKRLEVFFTDSLAKN